MSYCGSQVVRMNDMTKEKTSFVMYKNWALLISNLPDEEAGKLIKAVCQYQLGNEPCIDEPSLNAIYQMFLPKMKEDADSYEHTKQMRAEASKQRWKNPKGKQSNTNAMQTNAKAKPQRHKYGEYGHVLLTDEQYAKLIDDYGAGLLEQAIKNLDEYCQSSGKAYKDYNLVLRKWPMDEAKRDQKQDSGDNFFMRLANGEEHL